MGALPLPEGEQPCPIATRWIPPDRSSDHDTASGLAELTRWMTSISCAVRSLSQPSFLSTPRVNSGYPSLISEPTEYEPSARRLSCSSFSTSCPFSITLRLTTRSTPNRARNVPPPSFTGRLVLYRIGVPGCLNPGVPQHGQGRP